jgi:hypothetical protein
VCDTATQNAANCAVRVKFSRVQGDLASLAGAGDHEIEQRAVISPAHPLVEAGSSSEPPQNVVVNVSQPQSSPASAAARRRCGDCASSGQSSESSSAPVEVAGQQPWIVWSTHSITQVLHLTKTGMRVL